MCDDCGCGHDHDHHHEHDHSHKHSHDHKHEHEHDHEHEHEHHHKNNKDKHVLEVKVNESIFAANERVAERNRGFFNAHDLFVANIVSSPGSGKTTLLAKTIELLAPDVRCGVIVGDLETDLDARQIRATGAQVDQITTGQLCHLDAGMVARSAKNLDLKTLDILMIENVGNLVCPAGFDLGENVRIVLLSVTEGEDKPLKYPPMFRFADVVVISKTDLAPYAAFKREMVIANIKAVNPKARIIEVSAKTGEGMQDWCDFLVTSMAQIVELHAQEK